MFLNKKLKVSAIFTGLKSKAPLYFKDYPSTFSSHIDNTVNSFPIFDRTVLYLNPGNVFLAYLVFILTSFF